MSNPIAADLHIHTCYSSDADHSPEWIVNGCREKGIGIFTVSDHNTVRGAREAAAITGHGMRFIPGIEIDCVYEGIHMHLLGLGIEVESADFDAVEKEAERLAQKEFRGMFDNMVRLGFPVDMDDILSAAGGKVPTGELIGETLLTDKNRECELLRPYFPGGARSDMPLFNFYFDWFAQGCPAHVGIEFIPFREAVALVRDNGGLPVVAHPGQNFRDKEHLAGELIARGAAGLECFNNYHTPRQQDYFASLVVKEGVLMTCGSDFHGRVKPLIELGRFPDPGKYGPYLARSIESIG